MVTRFWSHLRQIYSLYVPVALISVDICFSSHWIIEGSFDGRAVRGSSLRQIGFESQHRNNISRFFLVYLLAG